MVLPYRAVRLGGGGQRGRRQQVGTHMDNITTCYGAPPQSDQTLGSGYFWLSSQLTYFFMSNCHLLKNCFRGFSFFRIKPRPWGIKVENVSFLPTVTPAAKLFTPSIGVYIGRLLINWGLFRWGQTASTGFLMLRFKNNNLNFQAIKHTWKQLLGGNNSSCSLFKRASK